MAGETLLAFVASDGPAGSGKQTVEVGSGPDWTLVKRANDAVGRRRGWKAAASSVLSSAT